MTPELKHFYLARMTLETLTPLSIAAGGADGVFDVALARDANGLPALPGSTLAGVLRHLYWELHGEADMKKLFGFQNNEEGKSSCLHISWGAIQDSTGQPVESLLLGNAGGARLDDPLLSAALAMEDMPVNRDRVRISHRGGAADTGKFDRSVLPAGYRFNAELTLWSDQCDDPRWQQVLNLLNHPLLRLGGGTRAGLGKIKVVCVYDKHFDLSAEDGRAAFSKLQRGLGSTAGLSENKITAHTDNCNRFIAVTLKLKPRGFWRIGEGDTPHKFDSKDKPADLLPKLESRVTWNDGAGCLGSAKLLIPASSLKGALAHRVAFHANRFAGRWAVPGSKLDEYDETEACPEIKELFGYARDDKKNREDKKSDPEPKGQAGRLFLDDAFLTLDENKLKLMMHNAIDRFTGGVREHMLFSEELVWKEEIPVQLTIDTAGIADSARIALRHALNDLCKGRLAIGGGAGKGHGFCDGNVEWGDAGKWINAAATTASDMEPAKEIAR